MPFSWRTATLHTAHWTLISMLWNSLQQSDRCHSSGNMLLFQLKKIKFFEIFKIQKVIWVINEVIHKLNNGSILISIRRMTMNIKIANRFKCIVGYLNWNSITLAKHKRRTAQMNRPSKQTCTHWFPYIKKLAQSKRKTKEKNRTFSIWRKFSTINFCHCIKILVNCSRSINNDKTRPTRAKPSNFGNIISPVYK